MTNPVRIIVHPKWVLDIWNPILRGEGGWITIMTIVPTICWTWLTLSTMWCFIHSGMFEFIFTCVWVDYCIVRSDWVGNLAKYALPAEPVPLVFYHLWSPALLTTEPDLSFHWALHWGRQGGRGIYRGSMLIYYKTLVIGLLQPFWNGNQVYYHTMTLGMPSCSTALSPWALRVRGLELRDWAMWWSGHTWRLTLTTP